MLLPQRGNDFRCLGKSSVASFRIDYRVIARDLKNPVAALAYLGVYTQRTGNLGRQPGGLEQIVSLHAIGDGDFHGASKKRNE